MNIWLKCFLFCAALIIARDKTFAQQNFVDSLKNVLEKTTADTARIDLLNELADELTFSDYNKAAGYAQQALELSQTINSKSRMVSSNLNLGMIASERGDFDKSLPYFLSALKISEEIGLKFGIGASASAIGTIYFTQGHYSKALEYLNESMKIAKEINSRNGMSACYTNFGQVYGKMGDCEKALYNYSQSLKMDEEAEDMHGIGLGLNNVGFAYVMQCPDKGFPNYKKALECFQKAMDVYQKIDDKQGMAMSLNNISGVYLEEKKFREAISTAQKGLFIAKEMDSKQDLKDGYKNLSDGYEGSNDFKNAYEFHKLYSDMKDSLLNEESSKQITEMQTKYETEKKEQQITLLNKDKELQDAQLNRQKIIIWSVAGGLLIVLILSIFIFRERRKSEKLLLNILPYETARELKANGKATAKHYESVTVMFTDFKGFTAIAEKLSAEELVSELDFLFKKFDEIISNYPMEKIKTIGDAYMCAGGLPAVNSTHAKDVVMAALEIIEFMNGRNRETESGKNPRFPDSPLLRFEVRIGIHTGPVTAGVVGDKKFAYDIWGDTVNTASRMESSGEAGKINISGSTYELIKDQFKSEFRGKISAKNKGEIEMYFVQNHNESKNSIVSTPSA